MVLAPGRYQNILGDQGGHVLDPEPPEPLPCPEGTTSPEDVHPFPHGQSNVRGLGKVLECLVVGW